MNSTLELSESHNGDGNFRITGVMNFDSVLSLNQHACELFPKFSRITIDLSGVTYVNSAGLALLLEWKRKAMAEGRKMELRGVPQKLLNIARMSELEGILPLQNLTED
jgi:phospholipid transport system transporter-binding protein